MQAGQRQRDAPCPHLVDLAGRGVNFRGRRGAEVQRGPCRPPGRHADEVSEPFVAGGFAKLGEGAVQAQILPRSLLGWL